MIHPGTTNNKMSVYHINIVLKVETSIWEPILRSTQPIFLFGPKEKTIVVTTSTIRPIDPNVEADNTIEISVREPSKILDILLVNLAFKNSSLISF